MPKNAAVSPGRGLSRPVWIPAVYLLAAAVALALPFMTGEPIAGIWAVLLTLPWSMIAVPIIDAIDPALMDAGLGMVAAGAGALINAYLLHLLLRRTS